MASKTLLVRSGSAVVNRLLTQRSPLLPLNLNHRLVPVSIDSTPKQQQQQQLFPSQSQEIIKAFPKLPLQNDHIQQSLDTLCHPCGIPCLPFFLPDASAHLFPVVDGSSSSEPILLFPKRTYQPSTLRRKRNHGFLARKATKGGRIVISRRIAKGRARVTA